MTAVPSDDAPYKWVAANICRVTHPHLSVTCNECTEAALSFITTAQTATLMREIEAQP